MILILGNFHANIGRADAFRPTYVYLDGGVTRNHIDHILIDPRQLFRRFMSVCIVVTVRIKRNVSFFHLLACYRTVISRIIFLVMSLRKTYIGK